MFAIWRYQSGVTFDSMGDQVMLAGQQLHLLIVNRRSGNLTLLCQRSLQSEVA